jgi:copper(I)-binding protein
MRGSLTLRLLAFLFVYIPIALGAPQGVYATDAWVAEGPPDAETLNAYMTLHNPTHENVAVIGATTAAAERVELRRSGRKGRVLGVEPRRKLVIPAGLKIRMQTKALHFALIHPKRPLKTGDAVDFILQLDNRARLDVSAEVRRP